MSGLEALTQIDAASHESRAQHKTRVEKRLSDIQEVGRLGIHMWEGQAKSGQQYVAPQQTLDELSLVSEDSIVEQMRNHSDAVRMPLLSFSLLPRPSTHRSVIPYEVMALQQPHIGYLFDLSQEGDNPPKVVVASDSSLFSRYNTTNKVVGASGAWSQEADSRPIYYEGVNLKPVSQLIHESAGDDATALTERKLDWLSNFYAKNKYTEWKEGAGKETNLNELLVAANQKHITGIFVPARYSYQTADKPFYKIYDAWVDCAGALAGLEHLKHGMDVPVMRYDVNGRRPSICEYIGQGRDELEEVFSQSYAILKESAQDQSLLSFAFMRKHLFEGLEEIDTSARHILGDRYERLVSGETVGVERKQAIIDV